ncbi:ribonuclease P protein subunit p25-like protein [Oppia nitens]|uniref:ribonuclease P protein subunit p25-like protein n=1 Tax=Oppia nitens TaxID=1686743 RepID=UPI0023DA5FD3|nr:ribonuclease P protein subunit p25-like protein [Oppia nitens]
MENYTKESVTEVTDDKYQPFGDYCPTNVLQMRVNVGTNCRNIVDYSVKNWMVNDNERHIVFTGSDRACNKVITCAELVKRKFDNKTKTSLYQMTIIGHKTVEELWKPKDNTLDVIKVIRQIPRIDILLCKDQLDVSVPGVQHKESNVYDDVHKVANKSPQNRNSRHIKQKHQKS